LETEQKSPVLEPVDRMSEIIFGLLMALSFTGTMSASVTGGDQVGSVLLAALGCNIAWGIVDAVMFVLGSVIERVRNENVATSLRHLPLSQAQQVLLQNMPPEARRIIGDEEARILLTRIRQGPARLRSRIILADDLKAAGSIFVLVVLSTLPPSLPFLFVDDLFQAMRISNGIALVMLFLIGAQLGNYAGGRRWRMAFAMASIGAVLVAITIALGG